MRQGDRHGLIHVSGGGVRYRIHLSAGEDDLRRQVRGYLAVIAPGLGAARDEAVNAVMAFLTRHNYRSFQSAEDFAGRVWPEMAAAFGETMESGAVTAEIEAAVDAAYRHFRIDDKSAWPSRRSPIGFTFGTQDTRTLEFVRKLDRFYLGKYISSEQSEVSGLKFLQERYLEQGEGIFGRGDRGALDDFRKAAGKSLDDLNDYQAQRIIDTSVVRMRGMGQILQMDESGVEEIEWITVGGACEICSPYDGKIFGAAPAIAEVKRVNGMSPSEFEQYLRAQSSARPQFGVQEWLNSGGAHPPLHPNCRCRLAAVIGSIRRAA